MGAVFANPIYRLTLPRRGPRVLSMTPLDVWPGNAARGAAIVENVFTLAGTRIRAEGSPFDEIDADPAWRGALHEFTWLRDLRAQGGEAAQDRARALVADWLARHGRWSAAAWRADILGRRLAAWAAHYQPYFASAPDPLRSRLLASMARQARHLGRVAGREVDGVARIAAIKGLWVAGLCLPSEPALLGRAQRLLEGELARQIGDDGGHAERSPARQLALLRDLIDMRSVLSAGRHDALAALDDGIAKTAAMLRLFRHGDGGFANFNGGGADDPAAIDFVLGQTKARGRMPRRPIQRGFERLVAGKLLVIADTGMPAPPGFDSGAHAGTLSFEASFGKERLIVNCGAARAAGPEWRAAARATAAHSTLALEDTNSSELHDDGTLGRRPRAVAVTREERDGNIWLSLSHDGYAAAFGLVHHRRLYLAAKGDELRGEDSLRPVPGAAGAADRREGPAYAIRFHIHPAVRISLAQDGTTVVLRQAGGVGWRMRVGGARIDLAESIYFGGDEARRSQQIVLSGRAGRNPTTVKWALRREGA
jgi:uncharacterized heparinase superfamily protein